MLRPDLADLPLMVHPNSFYLFIAGASGTSILEAGPSNFNHSEEITRETPITDTAALGNLVS